MSFLPEDWVEPMLRQTQVSNIFIGKYIKDAPGDYIKVYLYFLMLHQLGENLEMDRAVLELGMNESYIDEAFSYWKEKGALKSKLQVAKVENEDRGPTSPEAYKIADMFNMIEKILGRPIGGGESSVIIDWLSNYRISPEVVIYAFMLASKNKVRVNVRYVEAIVRDWSEQGMTSIEEIEEHLRDREFNKQEYRRIFRALGFHRSPTEAELGMMNNWLEEEGFSMSEILDACSKTTGIPNPNLNYVNQVLLNKKEEKKIELGGASSLIERTLEGAYHRLREKSKAEAEERKEEVYRKVPKLKFLDEEIKQLRIGLTKKALDGNDEEREALFALLKNKSEERAFIMTEAGFPYDYTDIKHRCKDCEDTGTTKTGQPCQCRSNVRELFGH